MSASVTPSSVSNAAAALPPTTPNTAAASTPRMPPELGTVTLLTFLMILPEHPTASCSGSQPSTRRANAAAYASAIGSVQPKAQMSSLFSSSPRARSRSSTVISHTLCSATGTSSSVFPTHPV